METRFGKYLVEKEIGKGGFGRVYSAFDSDTNRRVAIKVLASEGDSDLLNRFQAEAGVTARLAHRSIVTVYEFAHQNGVPYLVMELLEGRTLQEIIASEHQLPLLEKVEIMYQVGEGLRHAHARGVIHRDIKPGNIMVLPDGNVKIMDFGIARVMQRDGVRYTREGDLIGTVSYMAPEIFQAHEPDKRTDIFAYGVLYYELLTREHPFRADDPYTVMRRIMNDDPLPLNAKLPACPPDLAMLLQHLLMKDPDMRFEEFSDVLFDTEPVLMSLRQERATSLAKEVEPLLKAGDYEGASSRIKQILDLDPTHEQARSWRDQIRTRLNRQRADKLRHQGLEHMSALRFKDAVTCLEAALQLDASKSDIITLLDEARAAMERLRQSAELVNYARTDRQSGKLEEAFSKISRAIELDPANRDALSLRDSLRKQLRELRVNECLMKAEALRAEEKFDAALAALEELEPDLQTQGSVRQLWEQLSRERKQYEQKRRIAEFTKALRQAQNLLQRENLAEAIVVANNLCTKFPEQQLAYEFRLQAQARWEAQRRSEAIQEIVERAEKLAEEARFEAAKLMVADGLDCYYDEPRLTELAGKIEILAAAHIRSSHIKRALERAAALGEEGNFARAVELIEKAITRLGSTPEFEESLTNLKEKYTQQQYALNIERILAQGQFLLETGQVREVLSLLEKTDPQYKNEPDVRRLHHAARERARQEEEQKLVQDALQQAQLLEDKTRYAEALTVIDEASSRSGKKQELENAAARLKQKWNDQKQQESLLRYQKRIRTALEREDWASTTETLHMAQRAFPGHDSLLDCPAIIENGKRQTALKALRTKFLQLLLQDHLEEAEELLAESKAAFADEAIWISCQQELVQRKNLRVALSIAEQAYANQDYDKAAKLLENLQQSVSDERVNSLYALINERLRRPETPEHPTVEPKPLKEAKPSTLLPTPDTREKDRTSRDHRISEGRRKAAALAQNGDLSGAVKVLGKLSKQYPNSSILRRDLEAAKSELEHQRQIGAREGNKDKGLTRRIRSFIKKANTLSPDE